MQTSWGYRYISMYLHDLTILLLENLRKITVENHILFDSSYITPTKYEHFHPVPLQASFIHVFLFKTTQQTTPKPETKSKEL